jgi:hypothetical protein
MNTLTYIATLQDQSPAAIRRSMYTKGIQSSYDVDGRMVFYTSKNTRFAHKNNVSNKKLWLECNGLVIDTINHKVLVLPPMSYRSSVDQRCLSYDLARNTYEIYSMSDGTVMSLYYWHGKWYISTARGYTMGDVVWNNITYTEALRDVVPDNDLCAFYAGLDVVKSYTIGITHTTLHPFSTANKIWLIQTAGPDGVSYEEEGFTSQEKYTSPLTSASDIFSQLHSASSQYITEKKTNFGFILRSKSPEATPYAEHVILESSLMQQIRMLYYHSKYSNFAHDNDCDRELSAAIHAYVSVLKRDIFVELFPKHTVTFQYLDNITTQLVDAIMGRSTKTNSDAAFLLNRLVLQVSQKNFTDDLVTSFVRSSDHMCIYASLFKQSLIEQNLLNSFKSLTVTSTPGDPVELLD